MLFHLSLLSALITAGCSGGPGTGPSDDPPPSNNAPPVVTSIVVQGSAPREPAQYATLGETVNVTATVTDAETPVAQLTYEWTSSAGGTFSANAPTATWTAPLSAATPLKATLTLTVTERFGTNQTNRVTAMSVVDLHDSVKEVGDLAVLFLEDFSKQLPVDVVMRNFSASCPTAADERQDVLNQQNAVTVISYTIGAPATTVPFAGACAFRSRTGDACSAIPVSWVSRIKITGEISNSNGIDHVTAVLESNQWRLCASDYEERNSFGASLTRFWIQR